MEIRSSQPYKGSFISHFKLDDAEIMKLDGQIETPVGYVAIPLGSLLVPIPKPGILALDASADGNKCLEVATKKIVVGMFKDREFIPANVS